MKTKVEVICYEKGWIIESISRNYKLKIEKLKNVKCNLVFFSPNPNKDIYFHIYYLYAKPILGARNIIYVTHINNWYSTLYIVYLSNKYSNIEFACLSLQTVIFLKNIIKDTNIYSINQESIHFKKTNDKIKILTFGIFFRLYKDDRKSKQHIINLINIAKKNKSKCRLIIYGQGFDGLFDKESQNIIYDKSIFDKYKYKKYLESCDYVLAFGKDEGYVSVVDASSLGIKVLALNQGYHRDIKLEKFSQLHENADQIISAIKTILLASNSNLYPGYNIQDLVDKIPLFSKKNQSFLNKILLVFLVKNNFRNQSFIGECFTIYYMIKIKIKNVLF
jgi:hypothetical protein